MTNPPEIVAALEAWINRDYDKVSFNTPNADLELAFKAGWNAALTSAQDGGWRPIAECPMAQTNGIFLTGKKLNLPDPAFHLPNGWQVHIRRDMRGGAVNAFHSLGATHFREIIAPPIPQPPKREGCAK